MSYTIYLHTFPNNKYYVGITSVSVNERWLNGNGYVKQPYIFKAIQKYGWNNIKHEILEIVNTKKEAEERERYYITEIYHSNNKKYGYNNTNGGNYNGMHTEETKEKISNKLKGKVGHPISNELKQKISSINKNRIPWNKGLKKEYTPEELIAKKNKEKEYKRKWFEKNKELIKEKQKEYHKQYYQLHKEEILKQNKEKYIPSTRKKKTLQEKNMYKNQWRRERMKDPEYRLKVRMKQREYRRKKKEATNNQ